MAFFGRKRAAPAVLSKGESAVPTPPAQVVSAVRALGREIVGLREALTEALDGWEAGAESDEDIARIAAIRKQHGA